jgi:hypothetical protein
MLDFLWNLQYLCQPTTAAQVQQKGEKNEDIKKTRVRHTATVDLVCEDGMQLEIVHVLVFLCSH